MFFQSYKGFKIKKKSKNPASRQNFKNEKIKLRKYLHFFPLHNNSVKIKKIETVQSSNFHGKIKNQIRIPFQPFSKKFVILISNKLPKKRSCFKILSKKIVIVKFLNQFKF